MEPNLYKAAVEGNIEPFKDIAKDELRSMVTPRKNTILHVCIGSQTQNKEGESVSAKFVQSILERCPSLLVQVNAQGDAPLHVAAKRGHPAVVEVLIEFARNQQPKDLESGVETVRHMLEMINEEQNTVLHEAVRYDNLDVVKKLIKADLHDIPYSTNGNGETPLYMAAVRGSSEIVGVILEKCPLAAHEGPNGKNALHAAARFWRNLGVVELLLEKNKSLSRERDRHDWTPLHHAAYSGNHDVVSMLLLRSDDASYTACIGNKERKMTALHLAASQGYARTTKEIIRLCPECCDMVDDRGWNILHFAMVSMYTAQLKSLLKEYPRLMDLIKKKDVMGNTLLHLLAAFQRRRLSHDVVRLFGKGDYQAVNKQNISVEHIIDNGYPELEKEIEELSKDLGSGRQYYQGLIFVKGPPDPLPVLMKMNPERDKTRYEEYDKTIRESHLIVAALIATVAFAAAFTIPGGYNSSDGIAILRKNTAFQAFIISDTLAMLLSLSAVFIHFMTSMDTSQRFVGLFAVATWFTVMSMGAMVIAFVTGTYAILTPSLGLAITTCLISLCFFFLGVFIFGRRYGWIGETYIG